jgi:hypothetical protein
MLGLILRLFRTAKPSRFNLLDLPIELLVEITKHLDRGDLYFLRMSCRVFAHIIPYRGCVPIRSQISPKVVEWNIANGINIENMIHHMVRSHYDKDTIVNAMRHLPKRHINQVLYQCLSANHRPMLKWFVNKGYYWKYDPLRDNSNVSMDALRTIIDNSRAHQIYYMYLYSLLNGRSDVTRYIQCKHPMACYGFHAVLQ